MHRARRGFGGWRIVLVAIVAIAAAIGTPAAASALDTGNRQAVIDSYQQRLEPLLAIPVGWTGSVDGCAAGRTSQGNLDATLQAINYVRSLAGLRPVTLDAAKSRKAQAAALIMAANSYLTHFPPRDARCWTKAGYDGASHGNLFLSYGGGDPAVPSLATGARAVVGYMDDSGGNNELVGHRRWLMHQRLKTVGTGDTDSTNSIYVVGRDLRPSQRRWVPWPTAGYFPQEMEPMGRWSLSFPDADFSRAKVSVSTPDGAVKARKLPIRNGYADNTISWQMTLPGEYTRQEQFETWGDWGEEEPTAAPAPLPDYPVTVTVRGIRVDGRVVTRTWTTTLVHAAAPTG